MSKDIVRDVLLWIDTFWYEYFDDNPNMKEEELRRIVKEHYPDIEEEDMQEVLNMYYF